MSKVLGQFGYGKEIITVVSIPGKVRLIKKLWRLLDMADAPEQRAIIESLERHGAISERVTATQPK